MQRGKRRKEEEVRERSEGVNTLRLILILKEERRQKGENTEWRNEKETEERKEEKTGVVCIAGYSGEELDLAAV